jgi:1-acyl-sn-glycerol-3-phosphate acyltransferase
VGFCLLSLGTIGSSLYHLIPYSAALRFSVAELSGVSALLTGAGRLPLAVESMEIAVLGGFYIVPLYALFEQRSELVNRARKRAHSLTLGVLFLALSILLGRICLDAGTSVASLFLFGLMLNGIVGLFIYYWVPPFVMHLIVWLLIHLMYRIDKLDLARIPKAGAALLVCNHVSFMDALVIIACSPRPIRFVMYHRIFAIPGLRFVFRAARAIPIASAKEDPALLEQAFREISKALEAGDLVCIFPEGQITRSGEINPFRTGVDRILARKPVPVVPMALRGMWGSAFSHCNGEAMKSLPRPSRARIALAVGLPQPAEAASARALQAEVERLRGAWR